MSDGRHSVLAGVEEALEVVTDGAMIGIGGSVTAGHPMTLVRALARRGVKDLRVLAPCGGIEVDLLIAAGCVSEVWGSYVGIETVAAVGPVFRQAVQSGAVKVFELDEAHTIMGMRAAGFGLPFFPWRGGVGTSFPKLNPALVEFADPVAGEPLLAIPALELDVALIAAECADRYGNVQFAGTPHMDQPMGSAADKVIVQVERVVSTDAIHRNASQTHYWRDTTIVRAPFGTHPYARVGMVADEDHLTEFASAVRADGLDDYMARYVRDPADHDGYLEAIGIRRIASLMV